jgi:DNA-binding NarL/FixJ family response regulator
MPAAVKMIERARALAQQHGFDADLYLGDQGQVLLAAGETDEGLAILDEACRRRRQLSEAGGGGWREARVLVHHAVALRNLMGRISESLAILAEHPASPLSQDAADVSLTVVRIEALWAHGELQAARRLFDEVDLARVEPSIVPWLQCSRAELLYSAGDLAGAADVARTAMPPHWQPTSQVRAAWEVRILLAAGDLASSLEIAGRVQRLRTYGSDVVVPLLDAAVEANLAAGRLQPARELAEWASQARPDHPCRLRTEGMLLLWESRPEAASRLRMAAAGFARTGHRQDEWHTRRKLAEALRAAGDRSAATSELASVEAEIAAAGAQQRPGPVLSPREREVALLVAQGLRNREIAARLYISERTVENHVHRMLERAGLRSRAELAAQMARLSAGLSGNPE